MPLAGLYLTKAIVDAVCVTDAWPTVLLLLAAAALVSLFTVCLRETGTLLQEHQSQRLNDQVHHRLHRQAAAIDLGTLEQAAYHDDFHRALSEGPYRPARILEGLFEIARNGLLLTGLLGFLLLFQWQVAVLMPLAVFLPAVVRWRFAQRNFELQRDITGLERRCGYYHWLLTSLESAKEVRLLNLFSFFSNRFARHRQTIYRQRTALSSKRAVSTMLARGIGVLITFGCFSLLAANARSGTVTIGAFVMLMQGFHRGTGTLDSLFTAAADLYENRLFLSSYFRFITMKPALAAPRHTVVIPDLSKTCLCVENISFTYPGTRTPVLDNLSFAIQPGEVVALVGANGAGKSTLVKLLCRLYDPDCGRILAGKSDIRAFDPFPLASGPSPP